MKKKIAVVGLGYIGLPTLVALSKTGLYSPCGYDIDSKKIKLMKSKHSPIEDNDVTDYLKTNNINASDDQKILEGADIFIICVPTPVNNDFTPDYSSVISAIKTVAKYIRKNSHIVLESTVNPGTCKEILIPVLKENNKLIPGKDYNLAHCPERINPGDSKWNIYNINRNIGSINKKFNKEIASFYRSFIRNAQVNEVNSIEIAEATKIIENAFRDINIAYVNELAKSFDSMRIDLYETLIAASNKPFGFIPHWPGCGVGGHCIGVDPYYLINRAQKDGFNHRFLKLAREINKGMPEYTVSRLVLGLNEIGLPVKGTRVSLLGLSYKKNLNDTRESPALEIKKRLLELGANLTVYDPYIKTGCISIGQAVKNADALVIATDHDEFLEKLPNLILKSKIKIIIDGKNCLDPEIIKKANIIYKGIGR